MFLTLTQFIGISISGLRYKNSPLILALASECQHCTLPEPQPPSIIHVSHIQKLTLVCLHSKLLTTTTAYLAGMQMVQAQSNAVFNFIHPHSRCFPICMYTQVKCNAIPIHNLMLWCDCLPDLSFKTELAHSIVSPLKIHFSPFSSP